jgi:hypothetical protein
VNHLYRKSLRFAIVLLPVLYLWFGFASAYAQRPELRRPNEQQTAPTEPTPAKKKRNARAIGVVEFLSGGGVRLVPVALWFEGKYYDASLYRANPEPFALEPGTVYEAQNNGETAGTFVVNMPKQSNAGWIGDGRWTPRRAMDAQLAAEAAKQPKPKSKDGKAIFTSGSDEGPPVLRRPGSEESSGADKASASSQSTAQAQGNPQAQASSTPPASSPPQASSTTTTSDSTSGRPTLRRPNDEAPTSSPASAPPTGAQQASSPSADDNDPDRPVLHKPSASPQTASSAAASSGGSPSDENDPDRPVLSRGAQAAKQPQATAKASVPGGVVSPNSQTDKSSSSRSFAAISDANKYENRPLNYTTTPERQQELTHLMLDLALGEMRTFAGKHSLSPQLPKSVAIQDYDLRLFDLDFSNSATLVLTAKLPVATAGSRPFAYYATVVARLDTNGDPVKVFSSITDTTHLDVFPRLELIDALDADGNGRGDLLFRQYSDTGINYGLYRVFTYNMERVFEGGSSL